MHYKYLLWSPSNQKRREETDNWRNAKTNRHITLFIIHSTCSLTKCVINLTLHSPLFALEKIWMCHTTRSNGEDNFTGPTGNQILGGHPVHSRPLCWDTAVFNRKYITVSRRRPCTITDSHHMKTQYTNCCTRSNFLSTSKCNTSSTDSMALPPSSAELLKNLSYGL